MDNREVEALVLRIARLQHSYNQGVLLPKTITCLDLSQSVTWLHFVSRRWLFVASLDNYVSKVSCWDLSLINNGLLEPLAKCFLPGPAKTGQIEAQPEGLVITIGVGLL
jgi:hypothetical protein